MELMPINNNAPAAPAPDLQKHRMMFEVFKQEWLHDKSSRTQKTYEIEIDKFIEWLRVTFNHDNVFEVNQTILALYKQHLLTVQIKGETLSPYTINKGITAVRTFYTFVYEHDANIDNRILRTNPARKMKNVKTNTKVPPQKVMTENKVQQLFATETNSRNKAMLVLLYYGALRVSELTSLTFGQVQESRTKENEFEVFIIGKGSKPRTISIEKDKWDIWEAIQGQRTPHDTDDTYIFKSGYRLANKPLSTVQVHRILQAARERVNLPKLHAHMFRHSAATHFVENEGNIKHLQEFLGHSSLDTTSKYLHAAKTPNISKKLK